MYSIIETAKSNSLNVFQYLYMALLYMSDYKNEPAGIEMLLPWSDFIKEHCSGLIHVENIAPGKHIPCRSNQRRNPPGERVNTVSYSSLAIKAQWNMFSEIQYYMNRILSDMDFLEQIRIITYLHWKT